MDRISDLPDQILTQILSLLPAVEVARTMTLSKRWYRVWASVPVLVFDNYYIRAFPKRNAKFLPFVKGFLDHRENLPLDKFELEWRGKFSAFPLHGFKILSGVTLFMPRVLSICIYTDDCFKLPDSIFTCPSVEEMSLEILFDDFEGFIDAEAIHLPRLKKLELHTFMITNDFIRMLLSGCPALEELVFTYCTFEVDDISSTVLKKLTIDNSCLLWEMEISCPNVTSLGISSRGMLGIALKNMPSLLKVNFVWADTLSKVDNQNRNVRFLSGLSSVEYLSLDTACPDILDILATDIPNCPTLNNLKKLELGPLDMNLHWNLVVCFLHHSPNLKTLTLRFCQPSGNATEPELPGDFLLKHLETVKIGFHTWNAELEEEAVRTLRVLVKSIGEVIIL